MEALFVLVRPVSTGEQGGERERVAWRAHQGRAKLIEHTTGTNNLPCISDGQGILEINPG